jgi:hypothetical protein
MIHNPLPKKIVIFPLFLLLFCGLISGVAIAKDKNKGNKNPPPDPRILVTAVDTANQQVTLTFKKSGQTTVYTIDSVTQITLKDGSAATFKDIQVGQEVFNYAERDSHTLDSISVGPADPAPEWPSDTAPASGIGSS